MKNKFIYLFIYFISINLKIPAQSYKRWFLEQSFDQNSLTAVGYARRSHFKDSAAIQTAFLDACINYAIQKRYSLKGGQAFFSTSRGAMWMGSDFQESFDTNYIQTVVENAKILDTMFTKEFVAIIISMEEVEIPKEFRNYVNYTKRKINWLQNLPKEQGFIYEIGVAPQYYREISSWQQAEKTAIRNLAKAVGVQLKALEKFSSNEEYGVRSEEVKEVTIFDVQIVARHYDPKKRIFYILARIPTR